MNATLRREGCALSYSVEGAGPPVVLIQGVGVHGSGWLPQVRGLAGRFQCLTFDNRGIGASQPKGADLTVSRMAADTAALMTACGWESAHVVGHSLGGLIALHLALDAPKRIRSLSLLCTFSNGADATALSLPMLWTGLRTRIGTRRQRRHAFLELVLTPEEFASADRDAVAGELAAIFGHDLADQAPIAMSQLSAMRACDLTPRLGELRGIRTLVVSARHDRIAKPEFGRTIAAGIPGARYQILEDAAHGAPIRMAGRVNEMLASHCSGGPDA